MKKYTDEEHFKVIEQLNALAETLRQYNFRDDVKDDLSSSMRTMAITLAFEAEE